LYQVSQLIASNFKSDFVCTAPPGKHSAPLFDKTFHIIDHPRFVAFAKMFDSFGWNVQLSTLIYNIVILSKTISMLGEFATIRSYGLENKAEFRPSKSAAE